MKFYEFEGTTEYAIICAKDEKEALKCYNEEAEDKWKAEEEIKEITRTDAINLFVDKVKEYLKSHPFVTSKKYVTKSEVKKVIKVFAEEYEAFPLFLEHDLV